MYSGLSTCRPRRKNPSPIRKVPTKGSSYIVKNSSTMRCHLLNLPESPGQSNSPMEMAEEEVTKLSDQVRMEELLCLCKGGGGGGGGGVSVLLDIELCG